MLLLIVLTICFFNRDGDPKFEYIALWIGADLVINLYLLNYERRLISEGQLVLIQQKEPSWKKIVTGTVIALLVGYIVYVLVKYDMSLWKKLMLSFPFYGGLHNWVFGYSRGDFYIDTKGIIQPELYKNNYTWDEIHDFKINEDSISFGLNEKEYTIPVSREIRDIVKTIRGNEFK